MIPIVYRWDDVGAPVANGQRRSLCDLLYACLVTGYGSKAAAGWERVWVNGTFDKAVFRASAGNRLYLQIDGAGAPTANVSLVRAFESMSDIDTGLFPFNLSWNTYNHVFAADYQVATTAKAWMIIADDRFFYLFCWPYVNSPSIPTNAETITGCIFFGDIVSRFTEDPFGCALGCYHIQPYYGLYLFQLHSPSQGAGSSIFFPRASSGVATPITSLLVRGGGPCDDSYAGYSGVPYDVGQQIIISRPHLSENSPRTFRGYLPGFYYPCHSMAFDNFQQITADGKTFLSLRNFQYSYNNNIFISLNDWRT